MMKPPAFDCLICERHVGNMWPGARQTWANGTICRMCEYTYGGAGSNLSGATYRDRRNMMELKALASFLQCLAYRKKHDEGKFYAAA